MKNYRFLWVIILVLAGYLLADRFGPRGHLSSRSLDKSNPLHFGWEVVANTEISLKYWDSHYGSLQSVGEFPPGDYRITVDGLGELYFWKGGERQKEYYYKTIDPTGFKDWVNPDARRLLPLPSSRYGSLIGKLGNLALFHVGKNATFRIYKDEGTLPLRVGLNLTQTQPERFQGNRGSFSVLVERRK